MAERPCHLEYLPRSQPLITSYTWINFQGFFCVRLSSFGLSYLLDKAQEILAPNMSIMYHSSVTCRAHLGVILKIWYHLIFIFILLINFAPKLLICHCVMTWQNG